ncbi:MAG: presenilin family intramembrane aspartyl protease [Patescibacteria group bacterium]
MSVGLFVAYHYGSYAPDTIIVEPLQFSWPNLFLIIISFLLFSFILSKFKRVAAVSFKIFLILITVSGSQLFFASFLTSPWDILAALSLAAMMMLIKTILTHNIGIILGIAGIAALLGLSVTPIAALLIISALSIYDIISVYKTKHMVRLAENMVQSGAIFGFLIPIQYRDFLMRIGNNNFRDRCMILGSGDIGLPIMFAASLVTTSLTSAFIVAGFSAAGLFVTHLLFVNQGQRQAMAALPPIATASILGYFISIFL